MRRNERYVYCYYSKAKYYENYHLMTTVLENFIVSLKRRLRNGFDESQHESDLQSQIGFQNLTNN